MNRPFIDSKGLRGAPKNTYIRLSGRIRFQEDTATHLKLELPDGKVRRVSKLHARRLAHWLLDKCGHY